MNTHFKNALNQIKAEEQLILKTKSMLDASAKNKISVNSRPGVFSKKIIAIACSFLFVSILSFFGYAFYQTPVAYISLDINPSVELGVNAFNTVVEATSYNADGQAVLYGSQVVNQNIAFAIDVLVESASEKGFIAQDGSTVISVTSETNDTQLANSIQAIAEQGVKSALNKNQYIAAIYKNNIPLGNREEAKRLGVSPGKLNLIRKVQELDSKVTVEQFKDAKVTEIMNKYVVLKNNGKSNKPNNLSNTTKKSNVGQNENLVEPNDTNKTGTNKTGTNKTGTNKTITNKTVKNKPRPSQAPGPGGQTGLTPTPTSSPTPTPTPGPKAKADEHKDPIEDVVREVDHNKKLKKDHDSSKSKNDGGNSSDNHKKDSSSNSKVNDPQSSPKSKGEHKK